MVTADVDVMRKETREREGDNLSKNFPGRLLNLSQSAHAAHQVHLLHVIELVQLLLCLLGY